MKLDKIRKNLKTNVYNHLIIDVKRDDFICRKIYEIAYDYPPNSEEFKDGMMLIPYFSTYSKKRYILTMDRFIANQLAPDSIEAYPCANFSFSHERTFCDDNLYTFKVRCQAEFIYDYKQLSVASFIYDGKNCILLKTRPLSRLANSYTLVQGHVDFSKDCYVTDQLSFMRDTAQREIDEEIEFDEGYGLTVPDKPSFIINSNNNFVSLEHLGAVYLIEVENCKELYEHMTSNEEDKHTVELIEDFAVKKDLEFDSWSKMVIDTITNG